MSTMFHYTSKCYVVSYTVVFRWQYRVGVRVLHVSLHRHYLCILCGVVDVLLRLYVFYSENPGRSDRHRRDAFVCMRLAKYILVVRMRAYSCSSCGVFIEGKPIE